VRGQYGQQRSRKFEPRQEQHRMSKRLPGECADAPEIVPGDQEKRAVEAAALRRCPAGYVRLRTGAPDNSWDGGRDRSGYKQGQVQEPLACSGLGDAPVANVQCFGYGRDLFG